MDVLPAAEPTPRLHEALDRALAHLAAAQGPEGSWRGDYGGPMFLLPMYVGAVYVADIELEPEVRDDIVRYFRNTQGEDGGWGLHVEGPSMLFTSVLGYVALRLLGVAAEDEAARRALAWIRAHGGPLRSASWGRFFLAVLNLHPYEGLNPVPPELWLLPTALPVHPSRLWCHCRMVYLPMSWLYGARAAAPLDPLLQAIREEIYEGAWDRIDWAAHRYDVAPEDDLTPISSVTRAVNAVLATWERRPSRRLRKRALDFVLEQIGHEDRNTDYICIGPVSKVYHVLVWAFVDRDGEAFRRHLERLPDYLYQAADGTKMQGYNNSELWDTAFATQAILATGLEREHLDMLREAHRYIESNQVLEDVPDRQRCFREPSKGGWPFSTRAHGWPITDCTAEGLKCSLELETLVDDPIEEARLTDAVDLILYWQNPSGGWASYERTRAPAWVETLNPSNCFREIMIDYPYVECSSACLQALVAYKERFPGRRDEAIDAAVARGRAFLLDIQRPDGSWYGSWGICFTYGTWFGVHGLLAAGVPVEDPAVQAACDFLVARQLSDGGWGELAASSLEQRYVTTDEGQAVMTSWALLTLMAAGRGETPAVAAGLRFLVDRQREDGSWPDEHIAGMFNKSCAIHYDNYLKVFPLWALGVANRLGLRP